MTASHSVLYIPSAFRSKREGRRNDVRIELDLPWEMWKTPLLFMLSLALIGLKLFPLLLVLPIFLLKAWRSDRYNCVIMLFILLGPFGMWSPDLFSIKTWDVGFALSLISVFILKKTPVTRKILVAYVCYVAAIVYVATYSSEAMSVQIRIMRGYLAFITVFIPIAIFANKDFDIMQFMRKMMVFVLIMCIFYILDAIVFKSLVFVPATHSSDLSTFFSPVFNPVSLWPIRKYPQGIIIIGVAIVPIVRYFRLKKWQIAVIAVAMLSTQTFSVIMAFVFSLILFQGSLAKVFRFAVLGAVGLAVLVAVDYVLPYDTQKKESSLRVRSSIDQFIALTDAVDDEDFAEFASGRVAQFLPILDLIERQHKELVGLGYLHPEHTKAADLIIFNEYHNDIEKAEGVATVVEIVPVQVFVDSGWAGIIINTVFFICIILFVRRMRYRSVAYAAITFCFICGLAGFAGSNTYQGMSIITMAYAVVLLADKQERKDAEKSGENQSHRRSLIA